MKIFALFAVLLLIAQSRILHKHDSIVSAAGNDPVLNNPFSSTLSRLINQGGNSLSTSSVSGWSGSGSQVGGTYPGQAFPGQNMQRPMTGSYPVPGQAYPGQNMGSNFPTNFQGGNFQGGNFPRPNGQFPMGGSGYFSGNTNWPATSMSLSNYRPAWGTTSGNQWSPSWSNVGGGLISLSGLRCSGGMALPGGNQMGGRPIRLTCDAYRSSDICTTPQQCANLMCSRYIRCPSSPRISAA